MRRMRAKNETMDYMHAPGERIHALRGQKKARNRRIRALFHRIYVVGGQINETMDEVNVPEQQIHLIHGR